MIKTLALSLFVSGAALAQVQVQVSIPLPTITFQAPPPMVVVQPGVQVVQDYDDEVFFVDNYYWHRRDGHWFRTRTHTGGWVQVEERVVPRTISVVPVGKYRRWHGAQAVGAPPPGGVVVVPPPGAVRREERREDRREDRREERHEEKGHGSDKHKKGKH